MSRYDKMLVVHIFGGSAIFKSPSGKLLEVEASPFGYVKMLKDINFSYFSYFEFFVLDNFINTFYIGYSYEEFYKQLKIRMGIEQNEN